MDSRIREIEQWVAEAREGLSDGGREVYLRKLYLLEAEIRAVIKENGMLPQGVSPLPAERRVRRSASPARAFNMTAAVAGFCVLAATTFYFVNSGNAGLNRYSTMQPRLALGAGQPASQSHPPTRISIAYHKVSDSDIAKTMAGEGEELLPDSWTPATESSLLAASGSPAAKAETGSGKALPAARPVAGSILASKSPATQPGKAAPGTARPAGQKNKSAVGDEATDVLIMASVQPSPAAGKTASKQVKGPGSIPSSSFLNDRSQLAYQFFPEGMAPIWKPTPNETKKKMNSIAHDGNKDKKKAEVLVDNESGDSVDDSGDTDADSADKSAEAGDGADTEGSQSKDESGSAS